MKWLDERLERIKGWEAYGHVTNFAEFRLESNENWLIPRAELGDLLKASSLEIDAREYPDGAVRELAAGISKRVGISAASVVPCNGADQAIDLVCGAFLREGDRALVVSPTFTMYRLRATIAGAECISVPMRPEFQLPVEQLLSRSESGGVVFICSPNNPTGNQFQRDEVESLLDSFSGLVVLDEAYVEFADFSLSGLVKERPNLAILRTFSKAYGMAGLRLGYLLANEEWAPQFLDKVQYPYPISSVAASLALKVMARSYKVDEWTKAIRSEREWLARKLRGIPGIVVPESQANFLLVALPVDSTNAQRALFARGIATRNVGRVLSLSNCLRVTVGTRSMNETLLERLEAVCNK